MARGVRALPIGWDLPIPDAVWPEALISAVRQDPGALGSSRVIKTIRRWQAQSREDPDPKGRREARRLLENLGRALVGEPETDDILAAFDADGVVTTLPEEHEEGTQDAFQLPPKPRLRRGAEAPLPARRVRRSSGLEDDGDTDSRVPVHQPVTGSSAPPERGFEDDENPTTAFAIPEDRVPPPPPPPPPLPLEALRARDESSGVRASAAPEATAIKTPTGAAPAPARPQFEEDEKPTRAIVVPEEVLMRRVESAQAALADLVEATQMAPYPPRPASVAAPVVIPQHLTDDLGPDLGSDLVVEPAPDSRVTPRSGVVRRRPPKDARPATAPRPRAAMHHVRAMHAPLWPFAEELVPLSYERRARRFWARWREVAGDRGVRRDVVEELLRTATDTRTLVCELIAEAHQVDVRSVYTLVDKLMAEAPPPPLPPADPAEGDGPTRIPLMGSSVRPERDPK